MKSTNNKLGGSSNPPQFTPTFVVKKKLRFQAASAGTFVLQTISLGDLWCVAATATSAYQLASHCRLRKIEVWGPMSSSLVPVSVVLDWTGGSAGAFGKSNRVSDTSMSSMSPAHIISKPPPGSQIAQWQDSTSGNELCRLTVPSGAVIDVTIDMALRDNAAVSAVVAAVAGATVGANYIRALDNQTGSVLAPIGYSTI